MPEWGLAVPADGWCAEGPLMLIVRGSPAPIFPNSSTTVVVFLMMLEYSWYGQVSSLEVSLEDA